MRSRAAVASTTPAGCAPPTTPANPAGAPPKPDRPIGRGLQGCTVTDCTRTHYAKDLCRAHYERHANTGDVRAGDPIAVRRSRVDLIDSEEL